MMENYEHMYQKRKRISCRINKSFLLLPSQSLKQTQL